MHYKPIEHTNYWAADYCGLLGDGFRSLPFSLRVLAENAARHSEGGAAAHDVLARKGGAVPFRPARLLLHDMLGIPALIDIMAMRNLLEEQGGDPQTVDMSLPVDLVIDHSMSINHWADKLALRQNMDREFEVNRERFAFLKACETRFPRLRVIPPGGGICHQINLEYLGQTVLPSPHDEDLLIPDSSLGTDSHTPMINALGIAGWGIGGLEAEAILFGEATPVNVPRVIGLELTGAPSDDIMATDIALVIAERLRAIGVVDTFVELFGSGYGSLSVADRATIANMAPEYGSTMVFCPVDERTTAYLKQTGRGDNVEQTEAYCRAQNLWVDGVDSAIDYDEVVHIDLSRIGRSVAGPARPEQRIDLAQASDRLKLAGETERRVPVEGADHDIGDGDVIIAAITSCTNTANPRNMVTAGLVARNAAARGMSVPPHVKTSLAPGSRVVARYLEQSGLQEPLDALGFEVAAFSCSTCNGMSGPLDPRHEAAIKANDVKGVAVLSGNRNFAGRIHPLASRNMIASPPLVVAFALAGTILKDIATEPLGVDRDGNPVMLSDLWPSAEEVTEIVETFVTPSEFKQNYAAISDVNSQWTALQTDAGTYEWVPSSYVSFPPFVREIQPKSAGVEPMRGLRPLAILGDSITTDHISPSGIITPESEAGQYLLAQGVEPRDFNSFGTRRGCSDVVIRSTFANYRLRNEMTPDREGSWTRVEPDGQVTSIFKAIETYLERGQKLVVIGGKEYGCGSSRDTAAKAPWLAGVRAVIVESFERIHRSNLVNMGIAPLCFPEGVTRETLGLDGSETYDIDFAEDLRSATLTVHRKDGATETTPLDLRLYNDLERETFAAGGLLPRAFRNFLAEAA
ncbi:MAG: aconitate hydratase AcnA [Roseibium sp.]|uniref:aconitate hydratase AcnA n=1 Tax=Roseibium sp. TaxID=1936156 RepID=UPI001B0487A7|nr:aconitate hydratase AcnA [Roseibium sp.]MBO6894879.1 aconitate hydratase AcnA [Roseibium sp.]MBO6930282.1 aconitate hydratase AcnA [Roseibium sp.]